MDKSFCFLLLGGVETQLSKTEHSSQLCASFYSSLSTSGCLFPIYGIRKNPTTLLSLMYFIHELLWARAFLAFVILQVGNGWG